MESQVIQITNQYKEFFALSITKLCQCMVHCLMTMLLSVVLSTVPAYWTQTVHFVRLQMYKAASP